MWAWQVLVPALRRNGYHLSLTAYPAIMCFSNSFLCQVHMVSTFRQFSYLAHVILLLTWLAFVTGCQRDVVCGRPWIWQDRLASQSVRQPSVVHGLVSDLRSCMMAEFFGYSNRVEYVHNRTVRRPEWFHLWWQKIKIGYSVGHYQLVVLLPIGSQCAERNPILFLARF